MYNIWGSVSCSVGFYYFLIKTVCYFPQSHVINGHCIQHGCNLLSVCCDVQHLWRGWSLHVTKLDYVTHQGMFWGRNCITFPPQMRHPVVNSRHSVKIERHTVVGSFCPCRWRSSGERIRDPGDDGLTSSWCEKDKSLSFDVLSPSFSVPAISSRQLQLPDQSWHF